MIILVPIKVDINDPRADKLEVQEVYNISLVPLGRENKYKAIIVAVNHEEYNSLDSNFFANCLEKEGLIFDLKGIFRGYDIPKGIKLLSL